MYGNIIEDEGYQGCIIKEIARIAKGLAKPSEHICPIRTFYSKDTKCGAVVFEGPALVVDQIARAISKLMKTLFIENQVKLPTFYILSQNSLSEFTGEAVYEKLLANANMKESEWMKAQFDDKTNLYNSPMRENRDEDSFVQLCKALFDVYIHSYIDDDILATTPYYKSTLFACRLIADT